MDKNFVSRFLRGSFSTSLGTLTTVVFHFVSISLMTRFVESRDLGLYFLILAIANGGKTLGGLGLDLALVKYLSSDEESLRANAFMATIIVRIVVMLGLGIVIVLLGAVILPAFDPDIVEFTLHIPLLFILMSFRELLFFVLQGLRKFGLYAAIQTSSAILKAVLILVFSNSLDLTALIYIEFAMLLFSLLIEFFFIPFKDLIPSKLAIEFDTIRKILRFGFPLYVNSLLTYVSNFGGTFIVGLFLNPVSIAAYEVAYKLPQGVNRLFQSFSTVYFPTLSSLFAKDDLVNAQKFINKSLVLLASLTFSTTLLSLLFSETIINTFFSEQYSEVQPTFVLLMLSICLQLLAFTMGYSLVAAGVPEKSTRVNLIVMVSEFLLSIILVPLIGYIGVAVSFVLQTLIAQAMCYIYLRQSNIIIHFNSFSRPYLILIVTSLLYLVVNTDSVVFKLVIFVIYVGLSIFLIPDCHHAVGYLWKMAKRLLSQKKQLQLQDDNL